DAREALGRQHLADHGEDHHEQTPEQRPARDPPHLVHRGTRRAPPVSSPMNLPYHRGPFTCVRAGRRARSAYARTTRVPVTRSCRAARSRRTSSSAIESPASAYVATSRTVPSSPAASREPARWASCHGSSFTTLRATIRGRPGRCPPVVTTASPERRLPQVARWRPASPIVRYAPAGSTVSRAISRSPPAVLSPSKGRTPDRYSGTNTAASRASQPR